MVCILSIVLKVLCYLLTMLKDVFYVMYFRAGRSMNSDGTLEMLVGQEDLNAPVHIKGSK